MSAMHGIAKVTARDVATAFDLSPFRVVCDLGGRHQWEHMLWHLCQSNCTLLLIPYMVIPSVLLYCQNYHTNETPLAGLYREILQAIQSSCRFLIPKH